MFQGANVLPSSSNPGGGDSTEASGLDGDHLRILS